MKQRNISVKIRNASIYFTAKTIASRRKEVPSRLTRVFQISRWNRNWKRTKLATIPTFSDKNYYFKLKFCDALRPNWKSFRFLLVWRMCETHSFYPKSLNSKYAFGLIKVWVWEFSGYRDMRGLRTKLYFRNVVCCFLQLVSTDSARVDLLRKAGSRLFPEKQLQEKEECGLI